MYVCICHAVTDHEIESAVDAGADCVEAVTDSTRAGGSCGMCHDVIADMIADRCGVCPLSAMKVA